MTTDPIGDAIADAAYIAREALQVRIRALTPAQQRAALMYLAGWTIEGTTAALGHALTATAFTCHICGAAGSAETHRCDCPLYDGPRADGSVPDPQDGAS